MKTEVSLEDTTLPGTRGSHTIRDRRVSYRVRARHFPGAGNMKRKVEIRIGNLDVGSTTSRSYELEDLINRRKIDIMCLQEDGWCNFASRFRFLRLDTKAYKMFYHGVERTKRITLVSYWW